MAAIEVRERRHRRAAMAARLLQSGVEDLAAIDWDALDAAPAWLALPAAELATLQRQVGALVYAAQIRLWIDGARLAAARAALGEPYLDALLAQPDLHAFPADAGAHPPAATADKVPVRLQVAGAAVMLASLPQGALRRVVSAAMAPTAAAAMVSDQAQSLIARAQTLAVHATAAALAAAAQPVRGAA
jgi:hypothetical protein